MNNSIESVALRVVQWQALYGRNHLPWQQTRDPYKVWLSEIMLQQTQVVTVLGYYKRFLEKFPNISSLAHAPPDEVMGLWSGLGYYSRARNLHSCAQKVMSHYDGAFPANAKTLAELPGIGRSTAGAIAAFCFSERVPILDANVRRVLTRWLGFDKDLALAKNERLLWDLAETLLPITDLQHAMPRYTQGLMDLGATVCLPREPRCEYCPLHGDCVASNAGTPDRYPVKTRKLTRRSESWYLIIVRNMQGQVWLQRRPDKGIWAGMHCVPVFADKDAQDTFVAGFALNNTVAQEEIPPFLHVLTHRDLYLHAVAINDLAVSRLCSEGDWFGPEQWDVVGLPAPIRRLLDRSQMSLH